MTACAGMEARFVHRIIASPGGNDHGPGRMLEEVARGMREASRTLYKNPVKRYGVTMCDEMPDQRDHAGSQADAASADTAGTLHLTDPRALRALAHPVRLSLLGLLRTEGPHTASQAGLRLDVSAQSCTYHLSQLAKWGLVEDAGGGKGRERPWRATSLFTHWDSVSLEPEMEAAAQVLEAAIAERYFQRVLKWIERRHLESRDWQEAAEFGDTLVYLTPAELRTISRCVQRVLEQYQCRLGDSEHRPEGARPVAVVHLAFPIDDATLT